MTAWDVALEMFPKRRRRSSLSVRLEAVAHLDLAHSEGKIAYELNGQREVYKPLTNPEQEDEQEQDFPASL